jgi:Transposase IS116/IS110/IS902 family
VFRSGRDFAAWIGLVPRQDSTGGEQKLRGRGGRRVFPRAADAQDVGSISCIALIGRTSHREVLVISCLNRVAISYRDRDKIALDVRVVLLDALRGRNYRRGSFLGRLKVQEDRAPTRWRPLSSRLHDAE